MRIFSGILIPLLNLLVAMLLGVFLRYLPVKYIPGVNFKFFLHAHSHVAFLGWVYMALFIGLVHTYLSDSLISLKKYSIQFWLSQLSVLGMLIFFPIQGYALFSIIFSTMHILVSYWFCYSFYNDINKQSDLKIRFPVSLKFCKAALFFLILSSLGPWSLGLILSQGLASHPIYNLAIYFYLHFQYNGWFSFASIALVIAILESKGLIKDNRNWNVFFILLAISCIPAFFLSTLYLNPPDLIYGLSFLAATIQMAAIVYLIKALKGFNFKFFFRKIAYRILCIVLICFLIKILLQFFSVFLPIFEIRNFIIGYLHMVLIGFVSFLIIAIGIYYEWLKVNSLFKMTLVVITIGFFFSELIIFLQGIFLWMGLGQLPEYFTILFLSSILMPVGLIFLLVSQLKFTQKYFR